MSRTRSWLDLAINFPKHVTTQIVVAVIHIATFQGCLEVGAGAAVTLPVVQAPYMRSICAELSENFALIRKVAQLFVGVFHDPGVDNFVILAIEK
eukprot:Skav226593  [mRNA]  locus=scaffold3446:31978:36476:- [translate_table: standard]